MTGNSFCMWQNPRMKVDSSFSDLVVQPNKAMYSKRNYERRVPVNMLIRSNKLSLLSIDFAVQENISIGIYMKEIREFRNKFNHLGICMQTFFILTRSIRWLYQ
jgi:hypothetical protein